MNFEERDKPLIKDINSNIIWAERAEKDNSKIEYLTEIISDAIFFGIILKNRGDFKHSKEYIETAINSNKEITKILLRIKDESDKRS